MPSGKTLLRPRGQTREAYRLWFEFLQRAIAEEKQRVRLDLYAAWGDVTAYRSFIAWWREVGQNVIDLQPRGVVLVEEGVASESVYLIQVPKSMTSTEIGNEVRKHLISVGHQPRRTKDLRIADGKEIRPQIYRAYLHTYDQHRALERASPDGRVKNKDLLVAVRRFYLEREQRYRNSVRQVDRLPPALATAMNREDLNEVDVLASAVAINAVGRYLREANKIIDAVSVGRFPG